MCSFKKIFAITFIALTYFTAACHADTVTAGEAIFPRQIKAGDGTTLELNGIGFRRATILRVKAYAAALYVANKSKDPEILINQKGEKRLVIHFFFDVSKEDIHEIFEEDFIENNPQSSFISNLTEVIPHLPDIHEQDTLTIVSNDQGVRLDINGKNIIKDASIEFGHEVLKIWLGENPPNESLKEGLLDLDL